MVDETHTHTAPPERLVLEQACDAPLPELALQGLQLYNQGEYFEAHEALEAAWRQDQTAGRELYQGVLQVGIAYLQIERGNYRWRVEDVSEGAPVARPAARPMPGCAGGAIAPGCPSAPRQL